jgi:peptide/nickel transport system substrate-binding protein
VSVRACRRVRVRRASGGLLAVLAAGTLLQPGCSQPSHAPPQPTNLRIGVALQKTTLAGAGVPAFVNNILFDSVIGIGWDGRPADRAVSKWSWSDDLLTLTLTLRQNMQFHDGRPIDLPFFKESLERLMREARPNTNVSFKSVTSVVTEPPDQVVIKLSRPEAFLLTDLANLSLSHPTNPEMGFGPYKLVQRTPKARLTAFDKYYLGRPSIETIEVEEFEEQRGSWAALLRGDLDALHEINPGLIDLIPPTVKLYPFTRPYYIQLTFNNKHPVLKNPSIRQALSYAVDRQALIDEALNKQGTVAEGPIWPAHWAYSTAQKTYTRNLEAATLRLDSAGLRVKPSREPGRMPSRLRISCLTLAREARYEKLAMHLQKQLYDIGVDMEIVPLASNELVGRIMSGQFDTYLFERTSGRSLAWTYLAFHSSMPPGSYTAADKVLDRLRATIDEGPVRTAVSDLQQIFFDDPPAIFIAWPQVARVVSTKFVVPAEKGRDVMSTLWQWHPAETPR